MTDGSDFQVADKCGLRCDSRHLVSGGEGNAFFFGVEALPARQELIDRNAVLEFPCGNTDTSSLQTTAYPPDLFFCRTTTFITFTGIVTMAAPLGMEGMAGSFRMSLLIRRRQTSPGWMD